MKEIKLLLKTLLLSTSQINIFKHSTDKKKRKKIVGGFIGAVIVYGMIMCYAIAMCVGYGTFGMIDAAPVMCAIIISSLAFFFTIFKTNGYLFNFKEYDMLMSLPFECSTVAASKFLYMYIKSLPWYLSISVAMMIGYGIFAKPFFVIYIVWLLLSLFLPLIPMLAAAFLGFLIARISSGFKKTNLIQTILTFIFVIFCFSLRYIIEYVFRDDKVEESLENISKATSSAAVYYPPLGWFSDAITKGSVFEGVLLVFVSAVLFTVVFRIVGKSYRNINSALKSHAAAGRYKMTAQKKRSVVWSIAYKELKRMTGSTTYIVNGAMGELLVLIFSVIVLIFGFDKIVLVVTSGAPFDASIVRPAIPFIIYFFVGMMATTACSPSLEGKNYWIVQSLPIDKRTLYRGKMLFNMCLTVPFMTVGILCLSISAGVAALDTVLYLILGVALCCLSTAWGCVCGIKHMRLDWENEVEVVKQGAAVSVYLLPNMFVTMALVGLVIFLGFYVNPILLTIIFIAVVAVLAILSYFRAMTLAVKRG